MSVTILEPGLQTTIQAAPRRRFRQMGVPWSGPMDFLSAVLANRLCGNEPYAPHLEITLGPFSIKIDQPCSLAVTGAADTVLIDDQRYPVHHTIALRAGQTLTLPPSSMGMRSYLAITGGFQAEEKLKSASTLLAVGWGGHDGRALRTGDRLQVNATVPNDQRLETPPDLRRPIPTSTVLRVLSGPERATLNSQSRRALFSAPFRAARQLDRTGVRLEGNPMSFEIGRETIPSGPVFPGTIQCPPGGNPILLGPDAQTTGGYPRIGSVIAADLHLLGQVRPGSSVQLFEQNALEAKAALQALHRRTRGWLTDNWLDPWL